ncbi:replicative DNA helicase [Halobacillus aidingensis]|uniref:Replicative DNA helicase n=1 Tax=Halobacillus aidingensis TaxID=240303 RepID=A0A1H0MJD7_HALAD|nr:replicative DNA helicase [Halobacillus aidingensis]SDO80260.1 replicative DNA helicase [Halobacillus aidingensis]
MISNNEAEQAVLGSVLLEGSIIGKLTLEPDHFHKAPHQKIYEAMKTVSSRSEEVNTVTVSTELGEDMKKCGGINYLIQLADAVPSTEPVMHFQQLIYDAYRNRRKRELSLTYSEQHGDDALDKLIKSLTDLRGVGVQVEEKTTYDHLAEIANDMVSPPDQSAHGFPVGFHDFDKMTGGGPQRGDLFIVAARPSMGKTAFALNMASGHCKNGGSVDVFSLEMGAKQLLQRMISAQGNIDAQKWRTMSFSESDYNKGINAIGEMTNWDVDIHEKATTVAEMRAIIRRSVKELNRENHMVVIDYLQLMSVVDSYDRRDLEVGSITRELKLLARELNIPIILLSQLSRGVESRQDKRPMMSDLRESGNIEQDADVVGFLYRDDYYNDDSENQNIIEIILKKQRNGPTGTVELAFIKEYGKFVDLDRRYNETHVPSA